MQYIKDYNYIRNLIQTYEGENLQVTIENNFIITSFVGNKGGNEIEVTTATPYTLELYKALAKYASRDY